MQPSPAYFQDNNDPPNVAEYEIVEVPVDQLAYATEFVQQHTTNHM